MLNKKVRFSRMLFPRGREVKMPILIASNEIIQMWGMA